MFEETALAIARGLKSSFDAASLDVDGLCVTGGCALSCPTNTRLLNESGFKSVFVEPVCDDSGLSAGAALWVYHNLFQNPLIERDREYPLSPYLGRTIPISEIKSAVAAASKQFKVEELGAVAAARAAQDLATDRVIGWYEGRSEVGPRALGHRSILANPTFKQNWDRVNDIKGREKWRPFAPAVLKEDAHLWFRDGPLVSPYMLFTAMVNHPDRHPAITHVDGSSRIQTVTKANGQVNDVLEGFRAHTGSSVVLNTSFNGPGEPIVETPVEAIRFLERSEIDAIYIDGFRLSRHQKPA
ncbi:MAG: hypothetical protein EXR10_11945 [Alphaproteobacteria bacterium]|nr:hypothetical protein [Alphaproteobacteria bacterium]